MSHPTHETLVMTFRKALGLLAPERDADLKRSVAQLCDQAADPRYRIVVFGPFN